MFDLRRFYVTIGLRALSIGRAVAGSGWAAWHWLR